MGSGNKNRKKQKKTYKNQNNKHLKFQRNLFSNLNEFVNVQKTQNIHSSANGHSPGMRLHARLMNRELSAPTYLRIMQN